MYALIMRASAGIAFAEGICFAVDIPVKAA
jgi:hypothetical protein